MKKQEIIAHVEALLEPLAEKFGYEIVDVEYVKEGANWDLKVFADKEGGFSIDDCVELSRALDEQLEKTDPIETPYILEVSSPGLDRPLKTEKDFVRSHGKLVEVKLYKAMKEKGVEKEFTALLKGYDPKAKSVVLELEHGAAICLDQKEIASIRLAVIF